MAKFKLVSVTINSKRSKHIILISKFLLYCLDIFMVLIIVLIMSLVNHSNCRCMLQITRNGQR